MRVIPGHVRSVEDNHMLTTMSVFELFVRCAFLFCDDRVLFFCRKKCVMHFTSGSIQDTFSFCLERKDKRAALQRLKFVFHLPIFSVFSVLGRITQEGRSKSQYLTDRLNINDGKNNWVNPNGLKGKKDCRIHNDGKIGDSFGISIRYRLESCGRYIVTEADMWQKHCSKTLFYSEDLSQD